MKHTLFIISILTSVFAHSQCCISVNDTSAMLAPYVRSPTPYFIQMTKGSVPFIGSNGKVNQNNSILSFDTTTNALYVGKAVGSDVNQDVLVVKRNDTARTHIATFVNGHNEGIFIINQGYNPNGGDLLTTARMNTIVSSYMDVTDGAFQDFGVTTNGICRLRIQNTAHGGSVDVVKLSDYGSFDSYLGNTIGCDHLGTARSASTAKSAYFKMAGYTVGADMALMNGYNDASTSEIYIGGGSSSSYADTRIAFYTAANNTTLSGTARWNILGSGNFLPIADNTYTIGDATHQVKSLSTVVITATGTTTLATSLTGPLRADAGVVSVDATITSGTYTPTLTGVTNVSASTARLCTYSRIGNAVTVSGQFDIDPTLTLTATELAISLPIASALTTVYQLGGTASATAVVSMSGGIMADPTNDRASLQFICTDTNNSTMTFIFTYQVL